MMRIRLSGRAFATRDQVGGIDMNVSTPLQFGHSKGSRSALSIEKLPLAGASSRTRGHAICGSSSAPEGWSRLRELLSICLLGLALGVALGCDSSGSNPLGPDPREPTMSFEDAQALLSSRQFDAAIEALRPFASQPEPESEALLAYARALLGASRQSLAIWPLQRLAARPDAPPLVQRLYVSALLYGGAEIEAVREATLLLDARPDALAIRSLRAQGYESMLDVERAVEDMEIVVDESPGEARAVERLLNLLIKLEDWDGARERIAELRELLGRDGVTPEARALFCATASRFEHQRGDAGLAEEQLRGCLEESPSDPNLVFSLVELLDQEDRVDDATRLLEDVSTRFPGRQLILQGLASRYTRLDRHDEADRLLRTTAERIGQPESWLSLGDLRVLRGDLAGAAEAVDRAVEIALGVSSDDPDLDWSRLTPESRFGLADVYIRAEKYAPADRIIESLEEEPGFALLLRARARLMRGDPSGALADYQEAFRSFPSNPAARYLAGRAALEVGEFDLATEFYQDSLRSDSTATDAGLVLGQMLLAEGRTNWAIDTLSFYLTANTEEPHALRLMAQAGAASGQHKWAESVRAILAKNEEWAGVALADQAKDIAFLKGPEAALGYLAESPLLEEPSHFEAFSAWVAYAKLTGEGQAARERARKLTEENPKHAGPWIVWSRILYDDARPADAISAIRKAIELNPLLRTAFAELGEMLLAQGKVDEALDAFARAQELDPLDARAEFSAAKGLADVGRLEEAEGRLRALLIRHPWHGRAALELLDILTDRGEVDEWAYHLARRAARYKGTSGPRAQLALARIELVRGRPEAAMAGFEAAIGADVEKAHAQVGLAQALVALDRREEAVVLLEAALASKDLEEPMIAMALLEELKTEERVDDR